MSRIKQRGRPEETGVTKEFLDRLQKKHDDWLIHKNSTFPVPARVVVLNGNLPLTEFEEYLKEKEKEILGQI